MTLPNFLGVAAPKAGSTWLYQLLADHPDVFVPTRRKEIEFFSRHYDRGLAWYENFFPAGAEARRYLAIGEFTPGYLYDEEVLRRIVDTLLPAPKLLVILRNPVDRIYSHYLHRLRMGMVSESFESHLASDHLMIEWGLYMKYLRRCLRFFEREKILVFIFEEAVADVEATKAALGDFLGVDSGRFPQAAGEERVYAGRMPRARRLFFLSHKIAKRLRHWEMDWAVNGARKLGVERLFGEAPKPRMDADTRRYLTYVFAPDIEQLEIFLGRDLGVWKRHA